MKHTVCAVLTILSHVVIATDETPKSLEQVHFVRYEDFPHVLFTRDTSLTQAVLRDNIAVANAILVDEPTLLHRMTTGVSGFSGLPIQAARSVAMAQFLIDQGALDNPAETVTLLHATMDADIPSTVVHLYLDRGITPLSLNALHFTPLMKLALQSDGYADSNECLKKAQLMLEKLKPHEQYALFSVHDLACGRDIFACLKQIEEDDFVDIDDHKNSCLDLQSYLKKHYETNIKPYFKIEGYGENCSLIIKRQPEKNTTNPHH